MSDSFVRGEEGSGSGHSPQWEPEDEDGSHDWNEEGSGSGHGINGKYIINDLCYSITPVRCDVSIISKVLAFGGECHPLITRKF